MKKILSASILTFLPCLLALAGITTGPQAGGGRGSVSSATTATNLAGSFLCVDSSNPSASDTNSGTESAPFYSITNAWVNRNTNGTTIYVMGGSYTNQTLNVTNAGYLHLYGDNTAGHLPVFYYGYQITPAGFGIWYSNTSSHAVVWTNNVYSPYLTNIVALVAGAGGQPPPIFERGTPYGNYGTNLIHYAPTFAGRTNRMNDYELMWAQNVSAVSNAVSLGSSNACWHVTNGILYVVFSDAGAAKPVWVPSPNSGDLLIGGGAGTEVELRDVAIKFPYQGVNLFGCPSFTAVGVKIEGAVDHGMRIYKAGSTYIRQSEFAGCWYIGFNVNHSSPLNFDSPSEFKEEQNFIHDNPWHGTGVGGSVVALHNSSVCAYGWGSSGQFCETVGGQGVYNNCVSFNNAIEQGWNMDGGMVGAETSQVLNNCVSIGNYALFYMGGPSRFYAQGCTMGDTVLGNADTSGNDCYVTMEWNNAYITGGSVNGFSGNIAFNNEYHKNAPDYVGNVRFDGILTAVSTANMSGNTTLSGPVVLTGGVKWSNTNSAPSAYSATNWTDWLVATNSHGDRIGIPAMRLP